MNNLISSKIFNILLLITIIGEIFLPWILKYFYKGYNSRTMVMSVLGSPESPVGAGILSGLFSVNESKEIVTLASKIHGAGAAIGFMTLMFFPLL